jgi:hypothetical protein
MIGTDPADFKPAADQVFRDDPPASVAVAGDADRRRSVIAWD